MFQEPCRKHNARINHTTSSSLPIPYNPGLWLSYVWFLSSDFSFNTFVFYRSSNWNISNSIFQIPWEGNALKALSSFFQSLFCWEVLNREYENEIGVNYEEEIALGALDSLNLTHWLFCILLFFCALGRKWQLTPSLPTSIYSAKVELAGSGLHFLLFQGTFTAPLWLGYSWVVRDEVLCFFSLC